MNSRNRASELLDYLVEKGISEGDILNYLIKNWLAGDEALEALQAVRREFLDEEEEEENVEDIQIEDLIGKDFFHKDAEQFVYTIAECLNNKVKIVCNETQDVYYDASEVIKYFEDETWILIN
jgi:predicted transcriptional regulator